jgi:peptidoglycan/LPS O-acetylase OafA/YrhL
MSDRHIPALDGIRGFAVLFVIAFHCRTILPGNGPAYLLIRALDLGWLGVDLLFVLSGFLITGVLLDTRGSAAYFRMFYARRALRIFPLYLAYLFLILIVVRFAYVWIFGSDGWRATESWWYLTYLENWQMDHGMGDKYLGHLWSLAIEEQFYLIWPAVVWTFSSRRLAWGCLLLAVLAPVCRSIVGMQAEAAYRLTPCRIDALALGALVAIGVREYREAFSRWVGYVFAATFMGFLIVVSRLHFNFWNDLKMSVTGASLVDMTCACVVFYAATLRQGSLHRVLTIPLLRSFGKYSYAMYVTHAIIVELLQPVFVGLIGRGGGLLFWFCLYFSATVAITLGVAWLSWQMIEQPFLRLKRFFPYRARLQFAGASQANSEACSLPSL